jgi:predicted acetyltransferase
MNEIRILEGTEVDDFARVATGCYPTFFTNRPEDISGLAEDLRKRCAEDPRMSILGSFQDGAMQGGMIYYDFTMNIHGSRVPTGGVGLVAVALSHRKKQVCRGIIEHFLGHYDSRGCPLVELYPFRPDFYRRMGFGFGTPLVLYSPAPSSLPDSPLRSRVRLAGPGDAQEICAFYNTMCDRVHGLIQAPESLFSRSFEKGKGYLSVYQGSSGIEGFVTFSFSRPVREGDLSYDMEVQTLLWDGRDALSGLLGFLHSQSDQVRRIRLPLQDPGFVHVLQDPRDGSETMLPWISHASARMGVGIMYRLLGVRRFFEAVRGHRFGRLSAVVEFDVLDGFFPRCGGVTPIRFEEGLPDAEVGSGGAAIRITAPVEVMSSILMGSLGLSQAWEAGMAEVGDTSMITALDQAFRPDRSPRCLTMF